MKNAYEVMMDEKFVFVAVWLQTEGRHNLIHSRQGIGHLLHHGHMGIFHCFEKMPIFGDVQF